MGRGSLLGFGEMCLLLTLFPEEAHRIIQTQPSTPRSQQFPDSACLEMLHGKLSSRSSWGTEAAHLTKATWPVGEEETENSPPPQFTIPLFDRASMSEFCFSSLSSSCLLLEELVSGAPEPRYTSPHHPPKKIIHRTTRRAFGQRLELGGTRNTK